MSTGRGFAVCVVAVACTVGACRARRQAPRAQIESEEGRFPHDLHKTTACVKCHPVEAVVGGRPAVPGGRDHAPCDNSGCHREQFLGQPGHLCKICHERVDPANPGSSVAAAYPPTHGPRALASRFSHAVHLDYAAIETKVGFHVSCTDCHPSDSTGKMSPPGHTVCGRCHAPEAAPSGTPALGNCQGCHQPRANKPSRRRKLIVGDLHFRHVNHRSDRRDKLILCTECHTNSANVTQTGAHAPPDTGACVKCHDDVKRTPSALRMRVCQSCHATFTDSVAQLAPRSHLPLPARPDDHTLAFRRDHAADAVADSPRCARCHTFMSGSKRDTCDECHRVMRPVDHVVTWREFEHGSAARARADRCATCHSGDFCTTCHSRPPRSHFPISSFRSGHGALASFEMRACVTCHVVERDCTTSGCHTVRPRQ